MSGASKKAVSGRSSVHRRSDGDGWEGWISFGTDPRTGKRRRKHVRGRTKAEVDDKIKALEAARDRGIALAGPDLTLSAYLERWVAARIKVIRPNTLSGYRTDLLHVERSGIGRVKLRALTAEDVECLYAAVLDSGCSAGSVAHVRRTLSAALNTAARRGHILRNPVPLVELPRPDEEPELEPYDAQEIAALLSTARSRRNGVRWSLAFLGLRQGETLALTWDDVDLEHCELRIKRTLTWLPWRHGWQSEGTDPHAARARQPARAGTAGARTSVRRSRKRAGARSRCRHRSWPNSTTSTVDSQPNDSPPDRSGTTTASSSPTIPADLSTAPPTTQDWLDLVRDAGVRRLRLHDCRHSAATALLVLGADARVLMATMGWTSMSLVQRYTHMVPELRHDVAARRATLWPSAPERASGGARP